MGVLEPVMVRESDKRLVLGEWDDGEILDMQLVENLLTVRSLSIKRRRSCLRRPR